MDKIIADVIEKIEVLTHSSIRISGDAVLYFDPFQIAEETHDADVVFFTHSHYDHFSPEDFEKIRKDLTLFVMPESMVEQAVEAGIARDQITAVTPWDSLKILDIPVETTWAYNPNKQFHPKENRWVGYIVTVDGVRIFIAGDTDANPENSQVECDIAMVPVGGTYTFTREEAAEFVKQIHPQVAIPTHYGVVAGNPEDGQVFCNLVSDKMQVVLKY